MFSLKNYIKKKSTIKEMGLKILTPEELKSLQDILSEIYSDILFVCEKYGFQMMMGGGSALGTLRHNGFIPWDDDMDLMISRKDYYPFAKVFSKEFSDKYYVTSPFGISEYHSDSIHIIKKDSLLICLFNYEKIRPLGVAVDIVALEYVPENRLFYITHGLISNILLYIMHSKEMTICRCKISDRFFSLNIASQMFYYFRLLIGFVFSFISFQSFTKLFDRWISLCKESSRITIPSGRNHYFGETLPIEVFYPLKISSFEGLKAYIPNKIDIYLEKLYGENYMKIPPKEKREIHAYVDFRN